MRSANDKRRYICNDSHWLLAFLDWSPVMLHLCDVMKLVCLWRHYYVPAHVTFSIICKHYMFPVQIIVVPTHGLHLETYRGFYPMKWEHQGMWWLLHNAHPTNMEWTPPQTQTHCMGVNCPHRPLGPVWYKDILSSYLTGVGNSYVNGKTAGKSSFR